MEISETAERPNKRVKLSELADTMLLPGDAESTLLSTSTRDSGKEENDVNDDDVRRKEIEVGIIHYVKPTSLKITGMFKSRYTDFLVNEIDPDGQTLHLSTLKIPGTKVDDLVPEASDTTHMGASAMGGIPFGENGKSHSVSADSTHDSRQPSGDDVAKLNSHFDQAIVKEILSLYESILSKPNNKSKDHPIVQTPLTTDRTVRAQIHADIRRVFDSRIESRTDHSGALVLSAASRHAAGSNKNKNKTNGRLSWAEKGGEHLHFTLYKENKDSMEMVNLLARLLKTNSKTFRIAGTKDRRAATVQRVSAYRLDVNRLAGLNKTLRAAAVGNFQHKTTGLELGELSGNEFVIALREFSVTASPPSSPDRQQGRENPKQEVERQLAERVASLRQNGWINYFGLQRFGSFAIRSDVTGLKILQGDFEGACNSILNFNPLILNEGNNTAAANTTAVDTIGTDDRDRAAAISIWCRTNRINEALHKMPKRFSAETAVIRHLGNSPSDHLGALLAIPRTQRTLWRRADDVFERARALTVGEAVSGRYSIFDIVLPTPGWDVEYPTNESGDFYAAFMGSVDGGMLDPRDMRRKHRDFSLSGSYRKFLARIGPGTGTGTTSTEIRSYSRDDEPLLRTDLEVLPFSSSRKGTESIATPIDKGDDHNDDNGNEMKQAAILQFQLGVSQYATMALRELSQGGVREYKPWFSGGR
ncbi:hypothetical protein DV736_g6603, partial [Chaetothyriales sp. CBS 134916]